MTYESLITSLNQSKLPETSNPYILALCHDFLGNWHEAHTIVQDLYDDKASIIHAYLHRKEGDHGNANYWYRLSGNVSPDKDYDLDEEWKDLVYQMINT